MRVGLPAHLVQRPRWLPGIVGDGLGYILQLLALDRGPLPPVQPLLAGGLLFALLFNARSGKRGFRRRDWVAALVTAGGLATFVVAGDPRAGHGRIGDNAWTIFGVVTALAVASAVVLARRRGPAGQSA